jgi:competence protein ComEC
LDEVGTDRIRAGLRVDWDRVEDRTHALIAAERQNWPGWLAVMLGLGIAGYFALPTEPPLWLGLAGMAAIGVVAITLRRRSLVALVLCGLLAAGTGFTAAQWRTVVVAAPQLQKPIRFAHITGRLAEIEPFPSGIRATLDYLTIDGLSPEATPARIKVRIFKGTDGLRIGDRLDVLADLSIPAPPASPGAFDFRRQAYFTGIGANGYAHGAPRLLEAAAAPSLRDEAWSWIDRLRATIGRRIDGLEPGPAGALARALTVGDQTALTAADTDAMRISGLAHLLSISGLHIGMAAGLFFFGLRGLLALVPALALRYPIKKWSAAAAILAAGFYALLAGISVPTLRSFFMIAILFIGVLADRSPFSFRTIAWAAVALLLLYPESVTGASFQMSFFAVLGLIAAFEVLRVHLARWRAGRAPNTDWFGWIAWLLHRGAFWLGTMIMTSLVASLMTTPFALYHFDRMSTYGLVANLLAVPLTGFWVMPMGMAALLLMPFGLDAPFWHATAWGCEGILWVARTVTDWPHAVIFAPAMPQWALIAVSLGLVVLCLMRTRWRLVGLAPVAIGLASVAFVTTPDLIVSADAKLVAAKDESGRYWLSSSRAARLTAETWLRRNGQVKGRSFRTADDAPPENFACDPMGCIYKHAGRQIAVAFASDALPEDCRRADLIVSAVPIRGKCPQPSATIDFFDLWREGAHAVWIDGKTGFRIEKVAATLGDRPWVLDRMRQTFRGELRSPTAASAAEDDQVGANRPTESTEADDE